MAGVRSQAVRQRDKDYVRREQTMKDDQSEPGESITCPDYKQPWWRTEKLVAWYVAKGMAPQKRCRACLDKNKQAKLSQGN